MIKTLFVVELPSRQVTVSPEEHDDHRWVAQDQVEQLLHWPNNRVTWEQARRLL